LRVLYGGGGEKVRGEKNNKPNNSSMAIHKTLSLVNLSVSQHRTIIR